MLLKQRPLQQRSVIEDPFKNLENGPHALKKSFAYRLMSCQLPFIWNFLLQQSFPYSTLEPACYGVNWAHDLHGFPSPSDSKLVKSMLEAAKGELVKTCSRKNLLLWR